MYLPKHRRWPSQHLYLKRNSEFHGRKNPMQQCLKVVILHSAKSAFMFTTMQLYNTLNWPSSTWESFNIREKLGLFVLGVTHIESSHSLCQIDASGWCGSSTLVLRFDTWNINLSVDSNFFKKFKATASLPILHTCFRFFFL